jgi:acyl-CoA dehydrogenase
MRNWFENDKALQRIVERHLKSALVHAAPRLRAMGQGAANEGAQWAQEADRHSPRLVNFDRAGRRVDEIEYHQSYRHLQRLGYGGGIVAASYHPQLAPERGEAPKALTFSLGYLFAQAEAGLFCPLCMTDGAARLLALHAPVALREQFVPRLSSLDANTLFTGAMFLTEKEGGSDVGQIVTQAKGAASQAGDRVTLHGAKWFCSNVDADVIMILARPDGAPPGTRGLGLYLLPRMLDEKTRNHVRIDRLKEKLGERSFPTGEVTLEGAEAFLIGGPGEGFAYMADMLNLSRLYNAVASVAVMRRAVNEAIEFSETRVAFGKKIIEHPLMTEQLFDMACEQRVALNWLFRGVELMDALDAQRGGDTEKQLLRLLTPLLKYVLGKKAVAVVSEGVEALGGNGYIEDWPLARVFRDAQVLPIWEGTTNILVLDALRALKKDLGAQVLFAELAKRIAECPGDLQSQMQPLFEELQHSLSELQNEHVLRDFTDAAALLWSVSTSCSVTLGYGTGSDIRAARRVWNRARKTTLLRRDLASVEELRAVAFS